MGLVAVARGFSFSLYCGMQTAAVMWRRLMCGMMPEPVNGSANSTLSVINCRHFREKFLFRQLLEAEFCVLGIML